MEETMTVYTSSNKFEHWEGGYAKTYNISWIDEILKDESPHTFIRFPSHGYDDLPSIGVWHRNENTIGDFNCFGLVDFGGDFGETNRLFFPKWTDLLDFLKEYIPLLKGIIQLELDSIKLRNHYEVHPKK